MATAEVTGRRVIVVLGMHRSGTSCLAGSLQSAGLEMGEVHTWNPYNRRGNREHQPIVDFHDRLLARNGGAWDRPPARVRWREEDRVAARALVDALPAAAAVGFKDPRTLLAIDGWIDCLPRLEFVGVFRHPASVARSLAARSGMLAGDAHRLWCYYNRILLRLHRRHAFPLVDFDLDDAHYRQRVARLARQLGLAGSDDGGAPFFDPDLRTLPPPAGANALPYRARLLHWRLRRAARSAIAGPTTTIMRR